MLALGPLQCQIESKLHMPIMGQTAESGKGEMRLDQFDADADDWYIRQVAHECGENPQEVLLAVRRARVAEVVQQREYQSRRGESDLPWPPGFVGKLAQYIYSAAPRPVREVAVVAALGLMAGICGRHWQIPKSGLNIYVILVARSAIGKEAMHDGVSSLISACEKKLMTAGLFVNFTKHASGPALIKSFIASPCFVNVLGEVGHLFKMMATAKAGDAAYSLREQWTTLYTKSASTSNAGGISYSATDNNVALLGSVAYSMIGETTPGKFLQALSSDMMEDGFMSRFTVVEYDGERPDKNPALVEEPNEHLVTALVNVMQKAQTLYHDNRFQPVQPTPQAEAMLNSFEIECDKRIVAAGSFEPRRQMWNRAHLKVLRIAALLAVADNCHNPSISIEHASWAIQLVKRDITAFTKRLGSGDVGDGDNARERKLVHIMREYNSNPIPASYKVPDTMRMVGIVPRSYLQIRAGQVAAFVNHKLGANWALEDTLRSMVSSGYLRETPKNKAVEAFNYHGRAYQIVRLPDAEESDKASL